MEFDTLLIMKITISNLDQQVTKLSSCWGIKELKKKKGSLQCRNKTEDIIYVMSL